MFWGQEQGSPGHTRGLSLSLCLVSQQHNENKCSCSMKTSLRCPGASSGAHDSLLRPAAQRAAETELPASLLHQTGAVPPVQSITITASAVLQSLLADFYHREHHLLGLPAAHTHPAHSSALPAAPSRAGRPPPRTSWVWSRPFFRRMCARRFSFFRVMKCTQLCTRRSSISEAWGQQGAVGGSR